MFTQDRDTLRRFFQEAWRKARTGEAMEPLEEQIAAVARHHPEYHPLLEGGEEARMREYPPEAGETNPFLHLSLHVAILEQVGTDRPPGVRAAYQRLVRGTGDAHEAEHRIMDCLAEAIWTAQREGRAPDEGSYLECLQRLALRSG